MTDYPQTEVTNVEPEYKRAISIPSIAVENEAQGQELHLRRIYVDVAHHVRGSSGTLENHYHDLLFEVNHGEETVYLKAFEVKGDTSMIQLDPLLAAIGAAESSIREYLDSIGLEHYTRELRHMRADESFLNSGEVPVSPGPREDGGDDHE